MAGDGSGVRVFAFLKMSEVCVFVSCSGRTNNLVKIRNCTNQQEERILEPRP